MAQNRKITQVPQARDFVAVHTMKRACAYVRVSTDSDKQLQSLQYQTEYYERLIREHRSYEFCGIYSDAGISGGKQNRPGFKAMMEAARTGVVDLIFTKSISRFARNTEMLLQSVRELKTLGIGVVFEEQQINTLTTEGEFMLTILASFAEEERKSSSGNVRVAIRNKYKFGEGPLHTESLLGYAKNDEGNVVIDKVQAKIVRRIYRLYLDGMTLDQIAKLLNDGRVSSYTYNNADRNRWRIRRILANEKYVGDCCFLKYYNSDDGKTHKNHGEQAMYYIKNHHLPIICRTDWNHVQKRLEERKLQVHPYTSMLKCPLCGASLRRHQRSDSELIDWVCGTLLQKHKSACTGVRIPEETLKTLTAELLPLREQLIVLEVYDEQSAENRTSQKSFHLIPISQYIR